MSSIWNRIHFFDLPTQKRRRQSLSHFKPAEALEHRTLLSSITMSEGNLMVHDGDEASALSLSMRDGMLQIREEATASASGESSNGERTLTEFDPSSFDGKIIFDLGGGADNVSIDHSHGFISHDIEFIGGDGEDLLDVVGIFRDTAQLRPNGEIIVFNDGNAGEHSTIASVGAEDIQLSGMTSVTLFFPEADDTLFLDNGTDALTGEDALVLTGTTGSTSLGTVTLRDNLYLTVDTYLKGIDGNDTVTINRADNDHQNRNLLIATGLEDDIIHINGTTRFDNSVTLVSGKGTVNSEIVTDRLLTYFDLVDVNETETGELQKAIDMAAPGSTIYAEAKTYYETLNIQKEITIIGSSEPGGTIIDGGRMGSVLTVGAFDVELSYLTIQNGLADEGGGIHNSGRLNLSHSIVQDSESISDGGGVYSEGIMFIDSSALVNNTAGGEGGGLFNTNVVGIENSTIGDNSSMGEGGGVANYGAFPITGVTIAHNDSATGGGGVYTSPDALTELQNTLVAGNTRNGSIASDLTGDDVDTRSSFNLISDSLTSGGLVNGDQGNVIGVDGIGTRDVNTILAPNLHHFGTNTLGYNLVLGSAAINAGSEAATLTTYDQMGRDRIQSGRVDIGAIEFAGEDLILFDTATGRWKVGVNAGASFNWVEGARWNPTAEWQTFSGDVNGDGFVDGIGFNNANQVFFAVNDGTGKLNTVSGGYFDPTETYENPLVGDFDGNGTTDFAIQQITNRERPLAGQWYVRRGDGTDFQTTFFGRWDSFGWSDFATGDFNGDGTTDIIGVNTSHDGLRTNLQYGLSNFVDGYGWLFDHAFAGSIPQSVTDAGWHNTLIGDWNGDGHSDIAIQRATGEFTMGVSNGILAPSLGTSARRMTYSTGTTVDVSVDQYFVGDFNADGFDDIAGQRSTTDEVFVSLTSFAPTIRQSTPSLWMQWDTGTNWGTTFTIDLDGDGCADLGRIVLGHQLTQIAYSAGTQFRSPFALPVISGQEVVGPTMVEGSRL